MKIEKLAKVLGKDEKVFLDISNGLISLESKLSDLSEDIRKHSLEVSKQTEDIVRLETGIKDVVINTVDESGKSLYSNERSRDIAIKQRQFENSLYQQAVKSRAKWKDELNVFKNDREQIIREIEMQFKIVDLFISLKS